MRETRQEKRRGAPVPEGTLIADKYVVGRVLASGGMGVVVEAHHEALDQRVAIKFLHAEIAAHDEAGPRFLREARAAAKIASDHIVKVFDVGLHDGVPFMVMEYLEGVDLEDHAGRSGPLALRDALDIVTQALDGLAQAHALGVVHRDLKPANLFLVERGRSRRVKILDFGISKLMPESALGGAGAEQLTGSKLLLGTPGYMSPEQVRSAKNVDARTDVWAIGLILYELLSGEPAFTGEGIGDVFSKIREEPLPPIRALRSDVPVELDRVIMKCLERDRDQRYPDAGALLDALSPFTTAADKLASTTSGPARIAPLVSVDAPTLAAASDARTAPVRTNTHATWSSGGGLKPATRWAVLGGGALVIAGLFAWLRAMGGSASSAAVTPPLTSAPTTAASDRVASPTATVEVRAVDPTSSAAAPIASAAAPIVGASAPIASAVAPITSAAAAAPRASTAPAARGRPSASPTEAPSARPAASAAAPPPPPKKKEDLGI